MLQQTQVVSVIPKFQNWMRNYPNLSALARTGEEEALSLWAGLGYYNRCKNLIKAAQYLINQKSWPQSVEEWVLVPGVGPYTSGALLSLCFNVNTPLVDGNVERLLSRFYCKSKLEKSSKIFFWDCANKWVEKVKKPGCWNEALMELGALICTPQTPLCQQCPLQEGCQAFRQGRVDQFPGKAIRVKKQVLKGNVLICMNRHRKILIQNSNSLGLLKGYWNFPIMQMDSRNAFGKKLGSLKHSITHFILNLNIYFANDIKIKMNYLEKELQWTDAKDLSKLFVSSLPKKIYNKYKPILEAHNSDTQ